MDVNQFFTYLTTHTMQPAGSLYLWFAQHPALTTSFRALAMMILAWGVINRGLEIAALGGSRRAWALALRLLFAGVLITQAPRIMSLALYDVYQPMVTWNRTEVRDATERAASKISSITVTIGLIGMVYSGFRAGQDAMKAGSSAVAAKAAAAGAGGFFANIFNAGKVLCFALLPIFLIYSIITMTAGLVLVLGTAMLPLVAAFAVHEGFGGTAALLSNVRTILSTVMVLALLAPVYSGLLDATWNAPSRDIDASLTATWNNIKADLAPVPAPSAEPDDPLGIQHTIRETAGKIAGFFTDILRAIATMIFGVLVVIVMILAFLGTLRSFLGTVGALVAGVAANIAGHEGDRAAGVVIASGATGAISSTRQAAGNFTRD